MNPKKLAIILFAVGVVFMLTWWGDVIRYMESGSLDLKRVKVVSNSGSPQFELQVVKDFEQQNPDVDVKMEFAETGSRNEVIFIAFVSGNPPDLLNVSTHDMRNMIATGRLRPMDDLLQRQLEKTPDFVENLFDREDGVYRFYANPNDPLLERNPDGTFKTPAEAARLLHMHGKFLGFIGSTGFNTLTYNKRVFRQAAEWFESKGEVDKARQLTTGDGEALPPTTWPQLREKARLITEYGKRSAEEAQASGQQRDRVYGMVVQGQRPYDLVSRGVEPLAAVAGSKGFNFSGEQWVAGVDEPVGFYEYESPAMLSAFRLFMQLQQDGSVLPGTESRHFEDSRSELGKGRAAMLIDGWHVALIAIERVPWSKNDIGSASLPVPFDPQDARSREGITQIIGEDLAQAIGQGVGSIDDWGRNPRSMGGDTTCITSLAEHPWAAWRWMTFGNISERQQRNNMRRGALPGHRAYMEKVYDPDWAPMPYQRQAHEIRENETSIWPEPPIPTKVKGTPYREVMHAAFLNLSGGNIADVSEATTVVRQQLEQYSSQLNEELAKKVASGEERYRTWSFPQWDASRAQEFYRKQAAMGATPADNAHIADLLSALPPRLQDEKTALAYPQSTTPWQVLWIPGLMAAAVAGWLLYTSVRGRREQMTLRTTLREAKRNWHAYVFVLPAMLALFAFVFYPSLYQFYLAAHSGSGLGPMSFVGWENFNEVFTDRIFWYRVLPNTFFYVVIGVTLQICIALVIANLLNLPLKLNNFVRPMFFIPLVTSIAAVSVIFMGIFSGTDSGINGVLEWVGLETRLPQLFGYIDPPPDAGPDWEPTPINWLAGNARHVVPSDLLVAVGIGTWHGLPYTIILIMAALQSIDPQLYEAAKVDGANVWHRFWYVTIPEILPILIVIIFNAIIGAARAFGVVYVLTEGGNNHSSELVSTYIFKWGFRTSATRRRWASCIHWCWPCSRSRTW